MFLNISLCEEKSKGNLRGTNDNSMNSYDFHPSLRLCPSYSYQHNIIMGYSYLLWCNLHKIVSTVRRCFMAFKTQCSLYSFNVRRFATELDWRAHLHWLLLHYASSTLQQRVALACSLLLFLSASVDKNCPGEKKFSIPHLFTNKDHLGVKQFSRHAYPERYAWCQIHANR